MAESTLQKPNLWDIALSKLSREQQQTLKAGLVLPVQFSDLNASINESREKATLKWRFKTRHGEIDIYERFGKIVSWVQNFIAVGDTVVTYDPGHAGLPWAALRLVLQILVNNATRMAKFVAGLERVAFYIYDCTVRENLYLTGEPSEEHDDLKNHILALYTTILLFLLKAKVFFEAGTTKRMLSSVIKSADEVVQLLDPTAQQASQIVTISSRIDARSQISTSLSMLSVSKSHVESMNWLRKQLESNNVILSDLHASMESNHQETIGRFDTMERHHEEQERLKILSWLSPIPYHQHHKQIYDEVLEGTGFWFLEDSQYIQWIDSDQSAMLWIHGIPGSGKSKLLSLAVQEALDSEEELPQPLYFYCSRTAAEPERARAEDIARSFVKQLSTSPFEGEMNTIPQYVLDKYKKAENMGFASGKLAFGECCDIISTFVSKGGKTLIYIDALDECTDEGRHLLIQGFNKILQSRSTSAVKLLISTRDSPHLATFFYEHKTYEICVGSDRNQNDIDKYVKIQLDQRIRQKRIMVDGGKPPSAKLQRFISTSLREEAQGMFRWVSLQLDYICTLHKRFDIEKRLGRLPKGLIESYKEVYDRNFEECEPEDRERLDIALSLLLLPVRPKDPSVFAKLIFWDNEQENDENEMDDDHWDGDRDDEGSEDNEESDNNQDGKTLTGEGYEDYKTNTEIELVEPARYRKLNAGSTTPQYHEVTRLCFNFVVFDSTTQVFRFAHTSVQEYLQNHNTRYKDLTECYGRLAERCISILLKTLRRTDQHFPKHLVKAKTSDLPTDDKASDKASATEQNEDTSGKDDGEETSVHSKRPKFFKVHSPDISPVVLSHYGVPWEWDECEPDLITITRWISWDECDIFWMHTRTLRMRDLVPNVFGDELRSREYPLPLLNEASGIEHDYWYFDTPSIETLPTTWERLLAFVEHSWALYTTKSQGFRHSSQLEKLEAEFQTRFAHQAWDSVKPLVYFSACAHGLRGHVEAWTSAHPRLARTAQRLQTGTTALLELCMSEHSRPEIAKILIDNGAETYHVPEATYGNPLCAALRHGHEAIASLMLEKNPKLIDMPGPAMYFPLYWAISQDLKNAASVVQMLLDHGASANGKYSQFHDETALHLAAQLPRPGVIELLLERGASINAQNEQHGVTPLMLAVRYGMAGNCKCLLARGADVHLRDRGGEPVLHKAVEELDTAIASLLLGYNTDINAIDYLGGTALHHAAASSLSYCFTKLLIENGINVEAKMVDGATALHIACMHGHLSIVKLLISAGADPNAVDDCERKPLWCAVRYGHLNTTRLLLPITADINNQVYSGVTALSTAAKHGYHDIAELLLDAGAEIYPQEPGPHCSWLDAKERLQGYGADALYEACKSEKYDVVSLFLDKETKRNPGGQYAKWSDIWQRSELEELNTFVEWVKTRQSIRSTAEMEALSAKCTAYPYRREEENKGRVAEEIGIPYKRHWDKAKCDDTDEEIHAVDDDGAPVEGDTAEPQGEDMRKDGDSEGNDGPPDTTIMQGNNIGEDVDAISNDDPPASPTIDEIEQSVVEMVRSQRGKGYKVVLKDNRSPAFTRSPRGRLVSTPDGLVMYPF